MAMSHPNTHNVRRYLLMLQIKPRQHIRPSVRPITIKRSASVSFSRYGYFYYRMKPRRMYVSIV
jgi:hypothetical protein